MTAMTAMTRSTRQQPNTYCGQPVATGEPEAIGGQCVRAPIRHRSRGMALPSALMLASMMLTTSAAWLEASIAHRRYDASIHDHLRATQAADSALALCELDLRAGIARIQPSAPGTPMQWMNAETFDAGAAYEPVPSWPGSVRPPQCLIEATLLEGAAAAQAYWITARGFGMAESTQAWLQLTIMREAGRERRAWRRIVTAPTVN